jgi:cytochrome c-type biogenesis protein CcmE
MHPTRKRRLLLIIALVLAAAVAAALLAMALQRNVAYLYTPNEVLGGSAGEAVSSGQARFRLGGMVQAGSFQRAPGSMEAHFRVDDGDATLPVVYTGILPDLFREKQAVVATGRMRGDTFVAEEVLAKHDETYMPKEVADKMGKAHQKHDVEVQAPAASSGATP